MGCKSKTAKSESEAAKRINSYIVGCKYDCIWIITGGKQELIVT